MHAKHAPTLPPVVLLYKDTVEAEHPGVGDPIEIALDELNTLPSFYAIGVDNETILGSFETLEEALEAAKRALAEGDHWRIDLELQDRELNPLHTDSGETAIYVLYSEPVEDEEEEVPEEIEWYPIEGTPWEDLG